MYCKIKITCRKCRCIMELEAHPFSDSLSFSCQNCGQHFPDENSKALANLLTAIEQFPSLITSVDDSSPDSWYDDQEDSADGFEVNLITF